MIGIKFPISHRKKDKILEFERCIAKENVFLRIKNVPLAIKKEPLKSNMEFFLIVIFYAHYCESKSNMKNTYILIYRLYMS